MRSYKKCFHIVWQAFTYGYDSAVKFGVFSGVIRAELFAGCNGRTVAKKHTRNIAGIRYRYRH